MPTHGNRGPGVPTVLLSMGQLPAVKRDPLSAGPALVGHLPGGGAPHEGVPHLWVGSLLADMGQRAEADGFSGRLSQYLPVVCLHGHASAKQSLFGCKPVGVCSK